MLDAASIVGQEFIAGAVADLVGAEAGSRVPNDLLSLVRKEVIRPTRSTLPGKDAFRFRHLLIRDAAYEAIPKTKRADLHERLADWIERVAGAAVAEQEEIVAYHLEQAHAYLAELGPANAHSEAIGRRAALRLAAAGRRAAARGDQPAAVSLLSRAASVGPDRGPSGHGACTTWAWSCRRQAMNPPHFPRSTRRSGWRTVPTIARWDGARASRGPRCRTRSTHAACRRRRPAPR